MEIQAPQAPRFRIWCALFVFSIVCLAAHASNLPSQFRTRAMKWILAVFSISLAFSFFGVMAHFVKPELFVGQKAEGALATLLLAFWVAGIPAVMKPANCIAVCSIFGVNNANLYFASWAGFTAILYIWGHYGQELSTRDYVAEQIAEPKTALWYALFAASLIVLSSSSQFHSSFCPDSTGNLDSACRRNAWAISLGVLGTVMTIAMVFMTNRRMVTHLVDMVMSGLLFVFYVFGVAFITFGTGSGTAIGNLYFSSWAGFVVSSMITTAAFRDYLGEKQAVQEASSSAPQVPTDAEIEGVDPEGPSPDVKI